MKAQKIRIDYSKELKLPGSVTAVEEHPDPGSVFDLYLNQLILEKKEGKLHDLQHQIENPVDLLIIQELIRKNLVPVSWKKVKGVMCFGTLVTQEYMDRKGGDSFGITHAPVVHWDGVKWVVRYQDFGVYSAEHLEEGVYCAVIKPR